MNDIDVESGKVPTKLGFIETQPTAAPNRYDWQRFNECFCGEPKKAAAATTATTIITISQNSIPQ